MDGIFFFFIIVPLLGWIAWWVLAIWLARKFVSRAGGDLERMFSTLNQQLTGLSSVPPNQRAAREAQIAAMFGRANIQLRQLDALNRERYDLRASELQGMAASAGIDWTPPSY
jgi:hypothetical protein